MMLRPVPTGSPSAAADGPPLQRVSGEAPVVSQETATARHKDLHVVSFSIRAAPNGAIGERGRQGPATSVRAMRSHSAGEG